MIMKIFWAASAASLIAGLIGLSGYEMSLAQDADETPAAKGTPEAADLSAEEASGEEMSPDEEAIRRNGAAFVQAYEAGDAKALAAQFAPDAEYVRESWVCCSGSAAIEESLTEFFKENPGCRLEKEIISIRFVSPGVAIEDGTTMCLCADESSCVECRYTTVHVKQDDKWLVASIHDRDAHDHREHSLQLEQLAWLQGEWVDEGDDALVLFSCQPSDNGNFLLRSFSIQVEGQEMMNGTQRIGWDPSTGKLRTWIFDSSGSFGEGVWYRGSAADELVDDGDDEEEDEPVDSNENINERWILKLSGVMADGKAASSTSIYTLINEHTMTWQSVDHEIAGVQQPDSEVITIVRGAADPELIADPETE